jgi:ligand-binding sensor domain-containing protein
MPAKFLCTSIALLCFNFAFSQKVEFEHITTPEGLASTNVTSIYKDSYGYMWFGTFSGLFKYDGYNAKNYLTDEDPNSGERSDVRCLFETKDKHILIGTLYGLCL